MNGVAALLSYAFLALMILLVLAPLVTVLGDLQSLRAQLVQLSPSVEVQPGGKALLRIALRYNGHSRITDAYFQVIAWCGGAVCANATSHSPVLQEGSSLTFSVEAPLNTDTLAISLGGYLGGVYKFRVSQEVSPGVLRG